MRSAVANTKVRPSADRLGPHPQPITRPETSETCEILRVVRFSRLSVAGVSLLSRK